MRRREKPSASPDYVFIGTLAALVVFGLVMLASASSDLAKDKFGDSFYYLKRQLLHGLLPGVIGFLIGAFIPYRTWERFATPLLITSIILLLLVFTPLGLMSHGARRWVNIYGFVFQPAEILKLTFFVYLSAWMGKSKKRGKSFSEGFLPFLFLIGLMGALLVLQPATTTAILILVVAALMYFTAGARLTFLGGAILLAALVIGLVIYRTPYRLERVITFLNPGRDAQGTGYHIDQAQIAIGSGGIFGVGYGKSTTKLHYLPEPIGDSIFAVIAEELGFIGATGAIAAFVLFTARGLMIGRRARDAFGGLLATGFTALIGLQAFVNIAAISGLVPLTGLPLPFISYGGTALAVFLAMCGIIANVSRYKRT